MGAAQSGSVYGAGGPVRPDGGPAQQPSFSVAPQPAPNASRVPVPSGSQGGNVASAPAKGLDAGSFTANFPMSTILMGLLANGKQAGQYGRGANPAGNKKAFEAPVDSGGQKV